ncbi:methylated-DNA--[protein]-cysteine S-methyltransferase [Virgisporangium ochraceum]|nr:methylated-DNA--[protein]-cysteine S-methyltransferase [Virgisporangium ochraceum]
MRWAKVPSPIGEIGVAVDGDGADERVCGVQFQGAPPGRGLVEEPDGLLAAAAEQLTEYFEGTLTEFDLPLVVRSGSEFERKVWDRIAAIKYGETTTYGSIATELGDPGAARAVGIACNHNPLPIVVPCHRVVGAGGKLVGFGGGLPRKVHLLELEARVTIEAAFR